MADGHVSENHPSERRRQQGRSEGRGEGVRGCPDDVFVGTSRVIIGKLKSGQISGSGSCWKITFVMIVLFR